MGNLKALFIFSTKSCWLLSHVPHRHCIHNAYQQFISMPIQSYPQVLIRTKVKDLDITIGLLMDYKLLTD